MPAGSVGTLSLNRFDGTTTYFLTSAELWVFRFRDVVELEFFARAIPDDDGLAPHASVSVLMERFDPAMLPGRRFEVATGWDERHNHQLSNFYLHDHEPLQQIALEVISASGNEFQVRWTASMADPEVYDGTCPEAGLSIEGTFRLNEPRDVPYRLRDLNADPRLGWLSLGLVAGFAIGCGVGWGTGWFSVWTGGLIVGLVGAWVGNRIGERVFRRRLWAKHDAPPASVPRASDAS